MKRVNKILLIVVVFVLLASCKSESSDKDKIQGVSELKTSELMKVKDAPNTCNFLSEENIKKWYALDQVKFLTQPMGMGIENSCNTTFFAKDLSTSLSIQLYAYESVEDLKTELEVIQYGNMKKVSQLDVPAFWDNGQGFLQKGLFVFYKGLKIVVSQPNKDAYSDEEHEKRAIKIAKDYLAKF